jgi:hypothetical protein
MHSPTTTYRRFPLLFLLIFLTGLITQMLLPWWIIAPIAFVLAFWKAPSAGQAFLSGFAGIALGWLLVSVFIHFRTDGILTSRMVQLLPVRFPALLILLTATIGGLVGGLGALAGYCWKRAV